MDGFKKNLKMEDFDGSDDDRESRHSEQDTFASNKLKKISKNASSSKTVKPTEIPKEIENMAHHLQIYNQQIQSVRDLIDIIPRFLVEKQKISLFRSFGKEFNLIRSEIEDLDERISKRYYEIAVMGLEKAGKTSFVNALLGQQLLPTMRERCTYIPTEIRSCSSNDERIEIVYLTTLEYDSNLREVEAKCREIEKLVPNVNRGKAFNPEKNDEEHFEDAFDTTRDGEGQTKSDDLVSSSINWQDEYKEIISLEKASREFLDRGKKVIFKRENQTDFEDLINETVSDPKIARAVKTVVIYTSNLKLGTEECDVVLYDVPGYDSTTIMHKKQSKENAKKADAIIFVKKFESPTLKQGESEMLKIFEAIDGCVPLKDKLIVAITSIDAANDGQDYRKTMDSIYRVFENRNIRKDRIFPICSIARKIRFSKKNEEKEKMQRSKANHLRDIGADDGFDKLSDYIRLFVGDIRKANLNKKFNQIEDGFKKKLKEFVEESRSEFSIDTYLMVDGEKESFEDNRMRQKMNWWTQEWKSIHERFQNFFSKYIYSRVENDISERKLSSLKGSCEHDEYKFLRELRIKYLFYVDQMIDETKEWLDRRYEDIWTNEAGNLANIAAGEAHSAVRKSLADEFNKKISNLLSDGLGQIVWMKIKEILDFITAQIFYIEEIQKWLLNDMTQGSFKNMINKNIKTLILRITRPAIDLFLRYPRHDNRKNTILLYKNEVMTLDLFYKDEKSAKKRGLPFFLISEANTFKDDSNHRLEFESSELNEPKMCSNPSEVITEINEDIDAFKNYLKYSIYYASGIEAFFQQEINEISNKFRQEEQDTRGWQYLVFKAISEENSKIPKSIIENFDFELSNKKNLIDRLKTVDEFTRTAFKNSKIFEKA
jgi:GTPase Era involved in 16S rRNA processing